MSQIPPNPANIPPRFAPPSQPVVPMYSQATTPFRTRTSGAAVTSLVLGILMCIPGVTGLGAIVFGFVGIRSTRDQNVRGRGIAIAGLILGIIGLLGWAGFATSMVLAFQQTTPDRAIAAQFITDLNAGNVAAAQSLCGPVVTTTQLQQAVTYIHGGGTFAAYSNNGFHVNWRGGSMTAVIDGNASFAGGATQKVSINFLHTPGGHPTIQGYSIQ